MEHILSFLLYLVTVTSIFATLAMSLDLQVGACGLVNFGQVVFLGVGAYTTAVLVSAGTDPLVAMAVSVLAGAAFGLLLSLTVRNLSGTYWGILSLAMAEVFRLIILNERWIADGANGLSVLVDVPYFSLIVVAFTLLTYLFMRTLTASPFGRVIRMIREGDRLPQSLGKNVLVYKIETMCLGGAIGGLAGSFYALMNGYISPDDLFPIETFIVWAMVVLGGRGNVTGIVLGTVLIQVLFVGTRFLTNVVAIEPDTLSALRFVVIGFLITAVMMWRAEGVLPERRRIYRL